MSKSVWLVIVRVLPTSIEVAQVVVVEVVFVQLVDVGLITIRDVLSVVVIR